MADKKEYKIYKRKDGRWCVAYLDKTANSKRKYIYGKTKGEVRRKLEEILCAMEAAEQDQEQVPISEEVSIKISDEINNALEVEDNVALLPQESDPEQVDILEEASSDVSEEINAVSSTEDDIVSWTLEAWVQYFLKNYKKYEIKETTYDYYMGSYRVHIKGTELGKMYLENIQSEDIQKLYDKMSKKGYNAKTIKHVYVIINMALKEAVKLQYIDKNVNESAKLPRKKVYEGNSLEAEDVKNIFENAREEKLYPIIVLTLCTGLRKGEIMALKWDDINFSQKELYVEGNLCKVREDIDDENSPYVYKIMDPKTVKSKRTVPLTEKAIDALLLQKERQKIIKEKYEVIYDDTGLVFTEVDGSFIKQRQFMNEYHDFLKRYHVPDIRFHDLRHTFATLLLEAGEAPKVIQELLGHSTIMTTMDIYAHVTNKVKRKAVGKLESLF